MSSTTAIVLAAGRGSRMGQLTATKPKCLTMLAGRSLLDWQLASLSEAGVRRVILVGGYRAEQLFAPGREVIENSRWPHGNMVTSLLCARDILAAGLCVVVYSDIVFHPSAVQKLLNCEHSVAITYDRRWESLWRQRFDEPLQDAETFELDGIRLVEIGRRATRLEDIQGQYMGLLRFTPSAWRTIENYLCALPDSELNGLDMTTLLCRLLKLGMGIAALPVEGRWCEVDSKEDLELYESAVAHVDAGIATWSHDWRWAQP